MTFEEVNWKPKETYFLIRDINFQDYRDEISQKQFH
jgi:hypothetical protein